VLIDAQLTAAGWHVCDLNQLDLINHPHSGVREVIMKAGSGRADYVLYVDRKIVGVIEAEPEGTTLSGVEWQSAMYATGLSAPQQLRAAPRDGNHRMAHESLPSFSMRSSSVRSASFRTKPSAPDRSASILPATSAENTTIRARGLCARKVGMRLVPRASGRERSRTTAVSCC
jgi:hypothetical protein